MYYASSSSQCILDVSLATDGLSPLGSVSAPGSAVPVASPHTTRLSDSSSSDSSSGSSSSGSESSDSDSGSD